MLKCINEKFKVDDVKKTKKKNLIEFVFTFITGEKTKVIQPKSLEDPTFKKLKEVRNQFLPFHMSDSLLFFFISHLP